MLVHENLLILMLLILAVANVPGARSADASNPNGRWRIETLDTRARFALREGVPMLVGLYSPAAAEHDWVSQAPEAVLPEAVEIGGWQRKLVWSFDGVSDAKNRITFKYSSRSPRLELVSVWETAPLPGPVEHAVTIVNAESEPVVFCPTPTISISVPPFSRHELEQWWVEKGAGDVTDQGVHVEGIAAGYRRMLFSGPTSSDGQNRDAIPWVCIHDKTAGRGLYGGIEFSGWTQLLTERAPDGSTVLSMGSRASDGAARLRIEPGGSLELPKCFVGVYEGDVDDGCNRLHRWVEKRLRPPMPGGLTPVLVNNSWGSGMAVDEPLARRMIDDCAELGIELYHVDAGWFEDVGDWHSHPQKLPNGLGKIADYAHEKGLEFGLWVGWTQGGAQRDAGDDVLSVFNPKQREWFGHDYPENWHNSDFTGAPVCLASTEAGEWCLRELRRMVRDYKLDLLEHDQVMIIDSCERSGHGHIASEPVDTSRAAAEGYYRICEQLLKENPDLLLEDCVNGGRLVDFGVAKRTHYICATDTYNPLSLRRAFYDASYPLPPSMVELYIGGHKVRKPEDFKYMLRSAMLGWCTIMMDTTTWKPEEKAMAKREFALYKEELRPLIASGNLYHVLPRPDGVHWDGVQYFDPKTEKGALMVFRPGSEETAKSVKLRGLNPETKYALKAEDGSVREQAASGKHLMEDGLTVTLPLQGSSDLVFFAAVEH